MAEALAQRRWSQQFVDPDVERRYHAERTPAARRRMRAILPPLVALWCGAVWFDLTAPPEMGTRNTIIRFAIGAPPFLAATLFSFWASDALFERLWQRMLAITYAALVGGTVALTAVAVGPFLPHAVIGYLLVLIIGGSLALLDLRALALLSAAGCAGELVVLGLDPEVTAFDLNGYATWILVAEIAALLLGTQLEAFQRRLFLQRSQLDHERGRAEGLLLNVMPRTIVERLKDEPDAIADHFDGVTVVFADIANFTTLAAKLTPSALVARLDDVFSRLDDIIHRHGLEKIKTIGDQYMAVAGAPTPRDDHAIAAARVALEICRLSGELDFQFRVGLASGPAVAGVIGKSRFSYDLWGDTVNLASRMESHGVPGRVQIDEHTHTMLAERFRCEDRGIIEVKGKGGVHTFFLVDETN